MILQPIVDIAEICVRKDVKNAIISPGSRSAPLTLAFARHPDVKTRMISDERSAAFIANGMAIITGKASVLVCTSGSAAYNYAPAIAEAYFQYIPILILTADRPPEWIDQKDGQTIRQHGIYGNHVKKSYQIPVDMHHSDSQWHVNRIVNEAINIAQEHPQGPVHINVPFREPFYPEQEEPFKFSDSPRIINVNIAAGKLSNDQLTYLAKQFIGFNKILLVVGQGNWSPAFKTALINFTTKYQIPVIADVISNLHDIDDVISHQDAFLSTDNASVKEKLRPELLISFGGAFISKQLKDFLRANKAQQHWHVASAGEIPDVFQQLTEVIKATPDQFLEDFLATLGNLTSKNEFFQEWHSVNDLAKNTINKLMAESSWNEFNAVKWVLDSIPNQGQLHLANSMAVRYANYLGVDKKNIRVIANRGTSGIDGSTSTAVGAALADEDQTVTLISGDMAFFYDRNAFWHQDVPSNLRVVVINNQGGGIFGLIDGPSNLPELEEFFITHQMSKANHLCQEFGLEYQHFDGEGNLQALLESFYQKGSTAKILELETNKEINNIFFRKFKQKIREI